MNNHDYNNVRLIPRHSGNVIIKELSNTTIDDEQRIGYEFIQTLFMEFAKESLRFGDNKYDFAMYPHYYRERQICGVITPILHRLCHGFVMTELPVNRKHSENTCWADYWCIYKNYTFVIEVKHSRDLIVTDTIRKNSVVGRWNDMKKQLDSILSEIKSFAEETHGVIRIGLHFISSRSNKKLEKLELDDYHRGTKERLIRFGKKLKADYAACWLVPEDSVYCLEDGVCFPGVMLMGKVYKPIKHM